MIVHENVPDEYKQRKYELGLEIDGERVTWGMIIDTGLVTLEKKVKEQKLTVSQES